MPKTRERVAYLHLTTDAVTGGPQTFRAKVIPDKDRGYSTLVQVEHRGKVYHLAPKDWRDSVYDASTVFYVVGEPYESRRAASAKRAGARGKMATWEQRALDDALLRVVREYGARGATAVLLAEDLFGNWNFQFTRGLAKQHGAEGAALTDAADRLHWSKSAQQSAVTSALARLQKAGKVTWAWGRWLRKGSEAKLWVAKEYDR